MVIGIETVAIDESKGFLLTVNGEKSVTTDGEVLIKRVRDALGLNGSNSSNGSKLTQTQEAGKCVEAQNKTKDKDAQKPTKIKIAGSEFELESAPKAFQDAINKHLQGAEAPKTECLEHTGTQAAVRCPDCNSENVWRWQARRTKGSLKQCYRCLDCQKNFTDENQTVNLDIQSDGYRFEELPEFDYLKGIKTEIGRTFYYELDGKYAIGRAGYTAIVFASKEQIQYLKTLDKNSLLKATKGFNESKYFVLLKFIKTLLPECVKDIMKEKRLRVKDVKDILILGKKEISEVGKVRIGEISKVSGIAPRIVFYYILNDPSLVELKSYIKPKEVEAEIRGKSEDVQTETVHKATTDTAIAEEPVLELVEPEDTDGGVKDKIAENVIIDKRNHETYQAAEKIRNGYIFKEAPPFEFKGIEKKVLGRTYYYESDNKVAIGQTQYSGGEHVFALKSDIELLCKLKKSKSLKSYWAAVGKYSHGFYFERKHSILNKFLSELNNLVLIEIPKRGFDCTGLEPTIIGKIQYWRDGEKLQLSMEGWANGYAIRITLSDMVALKQKSEESPTWYNELLGFTASKISYLRSLVEDPNFGVILDTLERIAEAEIKNAPTTKPLESQQVCPICGGVNIGRNGSDLDGVLRYWCFTCNRSYRTDCGEKPEEPVECPCCKSTNCVKWGHRENKNNHKQRYLCRDCKSTFSSARAVVHPEENKPKEVQSTDSRDNIKPDEPWEFKESEPFDYKSAPFRTEKSTHYFSDGRRVCIRRAGYTSMIFAELGDIMRLKALNWSEQYKIISNSQLSKLKQSMMHGFLADVDITNLKSLIEAVSAEVSSTERVAVPEMKDNSENGKDCGSGHEGGDKDTDEDKYQAVRLALKEAQPFDTSQMKSTFQGKTFYYELNGEMAIGDIRYSGVTVYVKKSLVDTLSDILRKDEAAFRSIIRHADFEGTGFTGYQKTKILKGFINERTKFLFIETPRFSYGGVQPIAAGRVKYWRIGDNVRIVWAEHPPGFTSCKEIRVKWSEFVALKQNPNLLRFMAGFAANKLVLLKHALADIDITIEPIPEITKEPVPDATIQPMHEPSPESVQEPVREPIKEPVQKSAPKQAQKPVVQKPVFAQEREVSDELCQQVMKEIKAAIDATGNFNAWEITNKIGQNLMTVMREIHNLKEEIKQYKESASAQKTVKVPVSKPAIEPTKEEKSPETQEQVQQVKEIDVPDIPDELCQSVLQEAKEAVDITGHINAGKIANKLNVNITVVMAALNKQKAEIKKYKEEHEDAKYQCCVKVNTDTSYDGNKIEGEDFGTGH